MKIIGITFFMFLFLVSFSLGLDVAVGFNVKTVLTNTLHPFRVMEIVEVFILIFFILMIFFEAIVVFIKKRKKS
ncbi:hypothetical protein D7Z54_15715 [Salibacterium salarium]|uniref:Uncharacterized protein n=1 Tax=Salibacterium salarium TaxID=284579 RepID=A0A3R9QSE5_9BACI|nr:hypothetical protein D7Z54_15715 [Salibacterium salarium]